MSRKSYFSILFTALLIVSGVSGVFAQTSPVSGTVELNANGTRTPVAGALIEVYRTDIKSGFPSAKTNKKGEFSFAGMPLGGVFIFSVSAPGCAPMIQPNIKAGMDKLLITMYPGDGSKLAEADARKGAVAKPAAGNGTAPETAELTADQKKAQADYEAELKRVNEKNSNSAKSHETAVRALKEGGDAFTAGNYDLAIAKYTEGLDADPEFVGSAPTFLNNRSTVLQSRAVKTYNVTVKETDVTAKVEGYGKARKDLADAANGYLLAWNILKNAPAADVQDKANYDAAKIAALRGAKEAFRLSVKTEQVDPTVIEAAKILMPEYLAIETEAVKKAEANLIFADLYRVTGDSVNAIAAYKKILETSPEDIDALAGAGLSMVNLGYMNTDKAMLQEGSNYLQKFAGLAPSTHKYKDDALALIDTLKKEQNVTPQKIPSTKKRN